MAQPPEDPAATTLDLTVPAPADAHTSRVRMGAGLFDSAGAERPAFLIIDERVAALHPRPDLEGVPRITLPGGEATKSFAVLERLLEALAEAGVERSQHLLAIGGGVVTDVAGLAASLYRRGIAWEALPTTLLAQVDAAVGGKTAINGRPAKNLFGTFHAPREVRVDPRVLATLDVADWRSGLGEVLKTALLGARSADGRWLFEQLEEWAANGLLTPLPPAAEALDAWAAVLAPCLSFKAAVVADDYREAGARDQLNLGHTFGHGIEAASGFRVPHGIAVAVGLGLALERAEHEGLLADPTLPARTRALARAAGLPTSMAELNGIYGTTITPTDMHAHALHDKKRTGGEHVLVLPVQLGEVTLLATREL